MAKTRRKKILSAIVVALVILEELRISINQISRGETISVSKVVLRLPL